MQFINLNDINVNELTDVKGLFYFMLKNDKRIWVCKSANPVSRVERIKAAFKNGRVRKDLLPATLCKDLIKFDDLLVHFKQVPGCELNDVYEDEHERLKLEGVLGKRVRDCKSTPYGFIEVTHEDDDNVVYYLMFKLTTGESRALTSFRTQLQMLRLMVKPRKSNKLSMFVNKKPISHLRRFNYKTLDGLVSRGSESARQMLLLLTDNAKQNNKTVLNVKPVKRYPQNENN